MSDDETTMNPLVGLVLLIGAFALLCLALWIGAEALGYGIGQLVNQFNDGWENAR